MKFKKKYVWGGQSNIDTSSPTLQVPKMGYTAQNNSPFSNLNKPTIQNGFKGGLTDGMDLSDKEPSNTFSGNYLGMATAAGTGIASTIGDVNNAVGRDNKANAGIKGGVNTAMNVVDTAFPIVGAVEGLAGTAGTISKATNPLTTVTGNSGKQYSYQTGKNGDVAAGWTAAGNPRDNFSNVIEDFSGTNKDKNHGQNQIAMGVADLFVPWATGNLRNKWAREAAIKDSMNAYTDNQTNRNFQTYSEMGGNIPSPPTQGLLKHKVVEYKGNTHANGGIAITPNDEVENREVGFLMDDGNKYIYSDKLVHKSGKSYAHLAKNLLRQIGK